METVRSDSHCYTDLLPGLPDDLSLECLTRLHYSAHCAAAMVCRKWRNLFRSKDLYYHRKRAGLTHKVACLVQALPEETAEKPARQQRYGISLFDPLNFSWERLEPVPEYPDGLPFFCQITSSEGKLIVMGGMDPSTWEPVRDVFIFDFAVGRWSRSADLPSTRSFFAVGAIGGEVIVAGGHDESKNALNSAWAMDVEKRRWRELGKMSEERDECGGVVVGGTEFWAVSGYATDTQGAFNPSAEVLDPGTGEWRRVDNCWRVSRSPRSCVGVREGAGISLVCWAEEEAAVQAAACGVDVGEWTLLSGAAYQGGPHGFYLLDKKEGQKGKFMRIDVAEEFTGFVQSGCSVEI